MGLQKRHLTVSLLFFLLFFRVDVWLCEGFFVTLQDETSDEVSHEIEDENLPLAWGEMEQWFFTMARLEEERHCRTTYVVLMLCLCCVYVVLQDQLFYYMAKSNLVSLLNSLHGKLKKDEGICFRKNAKGETSVYFQEEHSYGSLHSPAQERHRMLIAAASVSASRILADDTLRAGYEALWKASDGRFTSLHRYVVHLEYERMKNENLPLA